MRKLIPILFLIVGSGAGVGAGVFFKPSQEEMPLSQSEITAEPDVALDQALEESEETDGVSDNLEYLRLSNQFVIPLISNERVSSMIVATLSLEIAAGNSDLVLQFEPKIRDSFLRVMFDFAHIGGFDGDFTKIRNLNSLQESLLQAGHNILGDEILKDVLLFEISRQDY